MAHGRRKQLAAWAPGIEYRLLLLRGPALRRVASLDDRKGRAVPAGGTAAPPPDPDEPATQGLMRSRQFLLFGITRLLRGWRGEATPLPLPTIPSLPALAPHSLTRLFWSVDVLYWRGAQRVGVPRVDCAVATLLPRNGRSTVHVLLDVHVARSRELSSHRPARRAQCALAVVRLSLGGVR